MTQAAALELLKRRRARTSLINFTTATKPDYEVNWHHQTLCAVLDEFVARRIPRLIVEMPPRHGKSELVSRRLPAYLLGRNPDAKIIACSYSADLSSLLNRDVQRIIEDRTYGALFPDTQLWSSNVRAVADGSYLRNSDIFEIVNHRGYYRSAGVGGGITGMGFDFGIIDDPIKNRADADSRTIRESIWEWYTSTFRTRAEKGACILLTMTRWHEDDLAGRLIKAMRDDEQADQWTIIRLPAISEATPASQYEQRQEGEPLWPGKYPLPVLNQIRSAIGARAWAALYQQSPRIEGEKIVNPALLRMINADEVPPLRATVRRWDLAFSEKQGADYAAGALVGVDARGNRYILNVKRVRGRWTQTKPAIVELALLDGVSTATLIESNGTQLGYYHDVKEDARLSGRVVEPDKPEGTKEMRAAVWGTRLEDGIIYCVRGEWTQALLDEMDTFPNGEHDDQIDAISGAMKYLADRATPAASSTVAREVIHARKPKSSWQN